MVYFNFVLKHLIKILIARKWLLYIFLHRHFFYTFWLILPDFFILLFIILHTLLYKRGLKFENFFIDLNSWINVQFYTFCVISYLMLSASTSSTIPTSNMYFILCLFYHNFIYERGKAKNDQTYR